MNTRPRRHALLAAAAIGFTWYLLHGGLGTLDPTETGWLRSEDLSQHLLGWLHFRNAPWQWPVGHIEQLAYPVGTTVGFMDANPWLSVMSRPFSRWLPLFWQFQGWWLASCYTLLAVWGALLARLYTRDLVGQLLLASLITTAPPALLRVCHENLAAQWLLVAALYLCLRAAPPASHAAGNAIAPAGDAGAPGPSTAEARQCAIAGAGLLALSVGAHAYLSVMIAPLLALAIARRWWADQTLSAREAITIVGGYVAIVVGLLWAFGFVGTGIEQSEPGFGSQTADLVALINPVGWSRFLPSHPHTADEFEGFSYLGLGGLAVALIGCGLGFARRGAMADGWMWRTLFVVAIPYSLFALSDCIWFRGEMLFTVRPYIQPILPVLSIFRASGRFIWLLHYLLVAFGGASILRRLSVPHARVVLATCLLLQLVDLQPQDVREKLTRRETDPLTSPAWKLMKGDYAHLALYPPFYPSNQPECGWHYKWGYHVPYSFAAYAAGMSFNSNYAGRADAKRIGPYCRQFRADIEAGHFDDETVYVVGAGSEALFRAASTLSCHDIDATLVCVTKNRTTPLAQWLADTR